MKQLIVNIAMFICSFVATLLLCGVVILALTDAPTAPSEPFQPPPPIVTPLPTPKATPTPVWHDERVYQSDRWIWENLEGWKPEDYEAIADTPAVIDYGDYGTDSEIYK